jgi:hypothetical protein
LTRKALVEREKARVTLVGAKLNSVTTVTTRAHAEKLFGKGSGLVDLFLIETNSTRGEIHDKSRASIVENQTNNVKRVAQDLTNKVSAAIIGEKHPNSCKVDKVERGAYVTDKSFRIYPDNGIPWYVFTSTGKRFFSQSPTRKLDTDCYHGNVTDKCKDKCKDKWVAGEPVTQWSLWIDDVKVADCTNCEMRIDEVTLPGPVKTGATEPRRQMPVPTFAGIPIPYKPVVIRDLSNPMIGRTTTNSSAGFVTISLVSGMKAGALLNKPVLAGDAVYGRDIVGMECHGCAYAKWTGGPGYSERCDKCKLDASRPSYKSK